MITFLVTVSAALLCSRAFAASSYLGLAQGTPLGGFSQHGTLHGGLIPGGLYGNGASLVNQGLPLGHLPGPISGSGGYLDYAYGTGAHLGNPYGKSRFLKYLYRNPLGLANPYGALRNVGVGGVNEAEDETSSTSGAGGADFVYNNQIRDSSLTGIRGLHSSLIAGLGGFHSALLPHTSSVALGTHPYALGPHTSIAALGGFPYVAGHHDSLSAFSGILPNVGAAGQFPYGLQPHTPIYYLTGFPYAGGPHAPLPASTGFHAGLGPYPSLAETIPVIVSAALLCSHVFAASSYLGLAQGTPLGGFSQHGTLHGGLIPGGLYDNGASLVNHGLPLGHLPGPIYGSGGYLDYTYGTGHANPYGALRNVGVGGVNEAEDETSSTSGSGATSGADFVSNNQNGEDLTPPLAASAGFHAGLGRNTPNAALRAHGSANKSSRNTNKQKAKKL
ncbi:hypothetical protein C7M84_017782 [Penaeus vannamei]|uniref:Uncharacterized protein n=1 Tax=Penaeus vannamei TaxID=6689 RepID=A0A3R7M0X8_PENVA|nr:hypothetical protein C7M84_017782 [Penaeus vannamei]